jgi:hypothetical protein
MKYAAPRPSEILCDMMIEAGNVTGIRENITGSSCQFVANIWTSAYVKLFER